LSLSCAKGSATSGSLILNGSLEYIDHSVDFKIANNTSGCSSCAANADVGGLASIHVTRLMRPRFNVFRMGFLNGSFGNSNYWKDYDKGLLIEPSGQIALINADRHDVNIKGTYNAARGGWVDQAQERFVVIKLYDNAGVEVSLANKTSATSAILLNHDGTTEHYEVYFSNGWWNNAGYGRLSALMDRNGNATEIEYEIPLDPDGLVGDPGDSAWTLYVKDRAMWKKSKITDAYGRQILVTNSLVWPRFFVTKLVLPNGEELTYEYGDLDGYAPFTLKKVNHPDGSASTWTTTKYDDNGTVALRQVDSSADATNRNRTFLFSQNFGFDPDGSQHGQSPRLIRMVLKGGEISYANRIEKDASGNESYYIYEGGNKINKVKFASNGGATKVERVTGNQWTAGFFSTDPNTWSTELLVEQSYDFRALMLSYSDPLGRTTTIIRDSLSGHAYSLSHPDGTTSAITLNPYQQPLTYTDRLGRISSYLYDSSGNLLTQTSAVGTNDAVTYTYAYNTRGQVIEKRDALYDAGTPELHNTKFEYNTAGYLTKKIESADTAGGTRPETTFTYDTVGRLKTATDPVGRIVTYDYDNRNRHVKTTYNDSSYEEKTYGTGILSNFLIEMRDRNGIITEYGYDPYGRRYKTISAKGLPESVTTYRNFLFGTSRERARLSAGELTYYQFDHANRRIRTRTRANSQTTLTTAVDYDQIDRLRTSTDAYGRRTYYLYNQNDNVSKVVTETVPDGIKPATGNVPIFVANSSQTSQNHNYTLTDLANNTLETDPNNLSFTHKVTYTDPRDLYLQALVRDNTTTNHKFLITDSIIDAEGQRLISTDGRGNSSWTEHDNLGRTTLSVAAVGTPSEIRSEQDYDDNSNVVETRSPRHFTEGNTLTGVGKDQYTYNGRNMRATHTTAVGSPAQATQSWTYLLDGRSDKHTDFRGNFVQQLWHACCGRLQASIQADGTSTSIHNTDYKGNVTHTAVLSAVPIDNSEWHDPLNDKTLRETTARYDGRGRLTHTTTWLRAIGNVVAHARISLGDNLGVVIAGLDGWSANYGLTTTYIYDEDLTDGIGIDATYSTQLTELNTRYGYNPFSTFTNGYAVAVTNPAGETSVQISDSAGRTILSINPEGDLSTYHYDQVIAVTEMLPNSQTLTLLKTKSIDALGHENASYTDAAGRTLATEDALGNFSIASYNANSSVITTRDANGLGQTCDYDALNRPTTCADLQETFEGKNRTTTYNAASQPLVSTNADGETSTNVYDVRGRLESNTDGNAIVTAYTYDPNNNLLTLTDGKGETRSWAYDSRNLNTTKTYPGFGDVLSYSHDALGRIITKTDQNSDTCTNEFDIAGRLTSKVYKTGGTTVESTDTFTYDGASRILTTSKGRHSITTEHTYALDGLPLTEKLVADNRIYLSTRTYDAANRPLTHTYPSGETTHWAYDARNTITTVHYEDKIITTNTYDDGYRLTDQTFGNGINRTINYDRQDNLRSSDILMDGTQTIDDLTMVYNYAADKQITAEQIAGDLLPSSGFTSSYDAGNRLTNWNRPTATASGQTWNYDNAGNWNSTAKTIGTNTTTEARTHSVADQINTIAGNAATHDLKGNLTTYEQNGKNYTVNYDLDNRIVTADVDNDDVEYRYDAFGRRVIRKEGTTKSALIWWGNSECAEHKHQAGQTVIQNDIMEHPSRLNSVIARAVDGSKFKLQWYHKNYLDHVYAVSDDTGDILEHYRYTAFGEVTCYNSNGIPKAKSLIKNTILWNTRRRDEVTGYYMYKFRHYSAELGRWPSRDPIEERGGVNLYAFVGNEPIGRWDRLGREPQNIVIYPKPVAPQKEILEGLTDKEKKEMTELYETEKSIKESMLKLVDHYKNLDGFEVSSIEDANKNLRKCGDCIERLYIEGHAQSNKTGSDASILIGGQFGKKTGSLAYENYRIGDKFYEEYGGFELFKGVTFCKKCEIHLNGCEVGRGQALLNAISQATGCKVYAYNRICMVNGNTPGAKFSMPEKYMHGDRETSRVKLPTTPTLDKYIGDNSTHITELTPSEYD